MKQRKKKADIHEGLDATIDLFMRQNQNITIERDYAELPKIECYPGQLNQVFFALIENAIDAVKDNGDNARITVKTCVTVDSASNTEGNNKVIQVQISDNGSGIPAEIQSKIFDPFFTSKDVGAGRGLGLSLAYGIIKQHHGELHFRSEPGNGSDFFVEIPFTS